MNPRVDSIRDYAFGDELSKLLSFVSSTRVRNVTAIQTTTYPSSAQISLNVSYAFHAQFLH